MLKYVYFVIFFVFACGRVIFPRIHLFALFCDDDDCPHSPARDASKDGESCKSFYLFIY